MLLPMSKVVFQMIASVLEDIIAFIFHLPAGSTGSDDGFNGGLGQVIIGGKGVVIQVR